MLVNDPPVCTRCAEQPESLVKLEQHVRASQGLSGSIHSPKRLLDGASERISLVEPLNSKANKIGTTRQGQRMAPAWMTLLPLNRPPTPALTKPSSPLKHTVSPLKPITRPSTPFVTPPQSPISHFRGHPAGAPPPSPLGDIRITDQFPSPDSITSKDIYEVDQDVVTSPVWHDSQGATSRYSPTSQPGPVSTPPSEDSKRSQTAPQKPLGRHFSVSKGIKALRKSSAVKSNALPVGSCGSPKAHTPMPSQDITPARTPFFRELSSFFSSRAKKGKLALPSRLNFAQNTVKTTEIGEASSGKSGLESTCARCGVGMLDWWETQRSDLSSHVDRESILRDRICESCRATEPAPSVMPGAWE